MISCLCADLDESMSDCGKPSAATCQGQRCIQQILQLVLHVFIATSFFSCQELKPTLKNKLWQVESCAVKLVFLIACLRTSAWGIGTTYILYQIQTILYCDRAESSYCLLYQVKHYAISIYIIFCSNLLKIIKIIQIQDLFPLPFKSFCHKLYACRN